MSGRLYALRKIAAGDWSLMSNGLGTLYRFTRYDDGHALGLMDGPEWVTRWQVRAINAEDFRDLAMIGTDLDDMPWHDLATTTTRTAAIAYAEAHMENHPEGVPSA